MIKSRILFFPNPKFAEPRKKFYKINQDLDHKYDVNFDIILKMC